MQLQNERLVVRHHERFPCDWRASVTLHPSQAGAIVPSKNIRSTDGSIVATVVDCSLGGLGLETRVFLPRNTRLRVKIDTAATPSDPSTIRDLNLRVQRIVMIDRTPMYLLGTLFADNQGDEQRLVEELVALARSHRASASSGPQAVGSAPGNTGTGTTETTEGTRAPEEPKRAGKPSAPRPAGKRPTGGADVR